LALTLEASRGFSPSQHYVQRQMLDKQEVSGSIPLRPTKMMARYRVPEGHRQSHSERVQVEVPTVPRPTFAVGYEGRVLEEGDEVKLPEAEGRRLVEASVLDEAVESKRGTTRSKGVECGALSFHNPLAQSKQCQ
jgi:hypothetical protein